MVEDATPNYAEEYETVFSEGEFRGLPPRRKWDLIGPLPESQTYNTIVMMVDTKTKAIKLKLVNVTISALGAAVVMRNRVFREEGLPAKVISDRGPQFMSGFVKELYRMLGIEGNSSTAYHLQIDDQIECINREVEKYLQMFVNHRQDDWAVWLPLVEFAYNNTKHKVTGYSAFFLNRGQHPHTLPTDPVNGENLSASEYLEALTKVTKNAEDSLK
jgi:hypothetical protein